jgi:hypothetical protein
MLITWKVADSSSTYGTLATLGAVSLTGVQSADAGSLSATVGLFNGNLAVALSPSLAAGTYSEEVVALTGSSAGKYVLAATGNTMGTLTINPAQLSITVFDFSRTYGDPNPWWFSSRISGLKAGDDENSVGLAYSTTGTRTAAVGTYPISATITSQNYVVVSNTSGTLTITQRPLSWSVGNVSLTYGTSPSLGTAALSNVIGSDNVTGVVALFDSQNQFLPSRTTSVGQYQEKVVSLTGSAAGNYSCCNVGSWGYYTVTPKTLNWSVSNNTSTYGSYPTFGTPTLSGIVGADDVFGLVGLLGVASPSPTTPVGTYTEYVRGLAGGRAGNYVLAPNGTYGTLIIQQPPGYTSYVAQSSSTNNQKTTSTSNNTTPTTSTQNATQSLPPAPVGTLLSYSFTSTANTTPAKATPTSTVMAAISKQAPQLQGYLSDKLVDTAIKAAINIGMSTSNFTTQDWVDFVTGYFKSQGYRSLINNSVGGALTKGAAISVLADLSGEISAWIAKRNGASDGIAEFDKNLTGFVVTGLIAGPQAEALSASVKIIESGTQLTLLNISNFQGAIATAEDLANKADALAKDSLARGDHAQAAFYLKIANNERMAIVTIRNEHPVVATMIEIPGTISRFLNWLF